MIEIWGVDNQKLKLAIKDYQFGGGSYDEYDRNWLRIVVDVDSKQGKWISNDPCLLTWEWQSIIDWLKAIKTGQERDKDLSFIEPNLAFSILKDEQDQWLIRIHFDLESRPPNASDEIDYFLDFELNSKGLSHLISRLEKEMVKFPVRGKL